MKFKTNILTWWVLDIATCHLQGLIKTIYCPCHTGVWGNKWADQLDSRGPVAGRITMNKGDIMNTKQMSASGRYKKKSNNIVKNARPSLCKVYFLTYIMPISSVLGLHVSFSSIKKNQVPSPQWSATMDVHHSISCPSFDVTFPLVSSSTSCSPLLKTVQLMTSISYLYFPRIDWINFTRIFPRRPPEGNPC